jgi:L-lactate dehydrogenase
MPEAVANAARVAIVGTGNVGATYAHALLLSGLATEIVLINRTKEEAEGEAMDLTHAVPFAQPARVWAGEYADCAGAAITVLTAGGSGGGGSRLDLVEQNGAILGQIVPEVARHNPDGVILVATNPVDALTYASYQLSGLPAGRVIGSGAILDTARFRVLLGERFGVDPRDVHAYIVGEHGESAVPLWSTATVGGMSLPELAAAAGEPFGEAERDDIHRAMVAAAGEVASRKGATYYGVAGGLQRITEAILRDQRAVLAVSTLVEGYEGLEDVCLSLPCVVDRTGIARVLRPRLSPQEREGLRRSALVLREAQARLPSD